MYSDNFKITPNNNQTFTLSIKLSDEVVITRRLTEKEIMDLQFKIQNTIKEFNILK